MSCVVKFNDSRRSGIITVLILIYSLNQAFLTEGFHSPIVLIFFVRSELDIMGLIFEHVFSVNASQRMYIGLHLFLVVFLQYLYSTIKSGVVAASS